jgi:hypothetical protein
MNDIEVVPSSVESVIKTTDVVSVHLERLRTQVLEEDAARSYADWITKHTRLKGKPFSFEGHQYQRVILEDPAREKCVRKPAQCGISELVIRYALAFTNLHPGVTVIYILMTALFSQTFAKTRFDVVVDESPDVAANIFPGTDSSTVKRFLNNSFIFFKGASKSGQAISQPSDLNIVDEFDFAEDHKIITQFNSRLRHSEFGRIMEFSTPTVSGFGISEAFENSKQFVEMTKCCHCNHWFLPDYFEHVRHPDLKVDLREVNFFNQHLIEGLDLDLAYLECPKCGREVDQSDKYREFIAVDVDSQKTKHGYQITPFSCPSITPVGRLIKESTEYRDIADFYNFALGLPYDSRDTQLSVADVAKCFTSDVQYPDTPPVSEMGLDLGGQCACLTGHLFPDGHLRIYHAEQINLHSLRERYKEVAADQRVIASVIDAFPYTDTVLALQAQDPNAWACVFSNTKGLELFTVREVEEDQTKATFGLRQITAKRDAGLDLVAAMLREGKISFAPSTFHARDTIVEHLTDMRRVPKKTRSSEDPEFRWVKSERGQDHYFFALLFLLLATYLRGVSHGTVTLPRLVTKIRPKRPV